MLIAIDVGELAVAWQCRDAEVDRPVGRVGVSALVERLDHLDHRAEIRLVGRARVLLDRFEAERRRILAKRGDVAVRVLAQRDAGLTRRADRLVVHVGEVHDVAHQVALLMAQRAPEDVETDERAEIPDVPARVYRGPHVHPHRPPVCGDEVLFRSTERVVQAHGDRDRGRGYSSGSRYR